MTGSSIIIVVTEVCGHTATHCNTLQHTATHCNTLQHTCFRRIASFCYPHQPSRILLSPFTVYQILEFDISRFSGQLSGVHASSPTIHMVPIVLACVAYHPPQCRPRRGAVSTRAGLHHWTRGLVVSFQLAPCRRCNNNEENEK